ncbi:adipogenin isoform X2 [Empidonax traillii]|uniref:adipogenin isoform X2 n=1 Tax=Empidonax traillii TaxID=164674 RepID=UPI000FFD47C9|nr:adipogenin isoform X2 [Empidonax traillii]
MRYPLVPLVNELTFPLLFFWFCLPFVMLLIIMIIWLQLLLNEAQMPSTEKIKKESFDEPDSDSIFEDELTEEDNQSDASSTETQEESQPSDSVGRLRPKPAYLSSNPKNPKQSFLAVTSNSWSRSQKIRYSHVEKSNFCNIMMIFNVLRILLVPSYLIIYMAQLFSLLCEKAVKILDSLRLESRGLLASVLGRKVELSKAQRTTRG